MQQRLILFTGILQPREGLVSGVQLQYISFDVVISRHGSQVPILPGSAKRSGVQDLADDAMMQDCHLEQPAQTPSLAQARDVHMLVC